MIKMSYVFFNGRKTLCINIVNVFMNQTEKSKNVIKRFCKREYESTNNYIGKF